MRPQLNEVPAWLRGGETTVTLRLLDEERDGPAKPEAEADVEILTRKTGSLQLGVEVNGRSKDRAALAVERGDQAPPANAEQDGYVRVEIRERMSTGDAEAPSLAAARQHVNGHGSIEGYEPRHVGKRPTEIDDEAYHDWEL